MPLRNTKLPIESKRHIVRALARHERHADIVVQIEAQFGTNVNRRALAHYNPKFNARLDPELKALFDEAKAERWREIEEEGDRWRAKRQREKLERDEARYRVLQSQRLEAGHAGVAVGNAARTP